MDDESYEVIVDFQPRNDADRAFEIWLERRGITRADIDPEALIIDTGRGLDGRDVRRYWLKSTVAANLETLQ